MKYLITLLIIFLITATGFAQVKIADSSNTSAKKSTGIIFSKKDSIPYATLYFYRSFIPWINAPVKKVPVYINDSLIYKLKANTVMSIKVLKEGKFTIAIDDKGDTDIPVKVKFGKEYFFKCEVKKGLWFGKPTIENVTPAEGKADAGMLQVEK